MQFDQAGEIIRNITYYFAEASAVLFAGEHFYTSDNYNWREQPGIGIGERWDSARPWSNGKVPFFAPGTGSVCGSSTFWSQGCPSNAPPITYSSDGVPTCCQQAVPLCQCLYGGATHHQTIVHNWAGVPQMICTLSSNNRLIFVNGITGDACELEASGSARCGSGGFCANSAFFDTTLPPRGGNIVLESFNVATGTGTWVPQNPSQFPPGFQCEITTAFP